MQKGSTKEVSDGDIVRITVSHEGCICRHTMCDFVLKAPVCAFMSVHSQRHGYCTLGEALNRLDFSSAIQDLRRFNYVAKVSETKNTGLIFIFSPYLLLYLSPTAFPANSQVSADIFEWSCPEKLFQYIGEDCKEG